MPRTNCMPHEEANKLISAAIAWEREQYEMRVVTGFHKIRFGEPAAEPARLLSNCRNCGAAPEPVCSYCGTNAA